MREGRKGKKSAGQVKKEAAMNNNTWKWTREEESEEKAAENINIHSNAPPPLLRKDWKWSRVPTLHRAESIHG